MSEIKPYEKTDKEEIIHLSPDEMNGDWLKSRRLLLSGTDEAKEELKQLESQKMET